MEGLCDSCRLHHAEVRRAARRAALEEAGVVTRPPAGTEETVAADPPPDERPRRVVWDIRSDQEDQLTVRMRNPKTGKLEEVPPDTVVGYTPELCDCELRDRAWDPNRGRCMTCGRFFKDPRTGAAHPP
jgi:hypothetical protein